VKVAPHLLLCVRTKKQEMVQPKKARLTRTHDGYANQGTRETFWTYDCIVCVGGEKEKGKWAILNNGGMSLDARDAWRNVAREKDDVTIAFLYLLHFI
jgi:hypothetical protein